ncbi:MAG: hypothetical protein WBV82_00705 [Myxococcaceae bacterium]
MPRSHVTALKTRATVALVSLWLLAFTYALRALSVSLGTVDGGAVVDALRVVVLVFTACAYLVWFHRAVAISSVAGCDVRTRPAVAVASWFIPVANLVWPFMIHYRLLFRSNLGVLAAWAAVWLVGQVTSVLESSVEIARSHPEIEPQLEAPMASIHWWLSLVGSTLLMIAAGLGALLVGHSTRLMTSRLNDLAEDGT